MGSKIKIKLKKENEEWRTRAMRLAVKYTTPMHGGFYDMGDTYPLPEYEGLPKPPTQ